MVKDLRIIMGWRMILGSDLNLVTGMGGYRRREEFLLDGLEAELPMKKISMDLYSFMCSNFYILTLFQSL